MNVYLYLFLSMIAGMLADANVSPERVTNNLSQEAQPLSFENFLQFNQNFLNPWRTKAKISTHDMHPVFTQGPDLPTTEGLPQPVSATIFDKVFSEPHNLAFDSNKEEFKSTISLGLEDMSSEENKTISQSSAVSATTPTENTRSAMPTTDVALGQHKPFSIPLSAAAKEYVMAIQELCEENKDKDEKFAELSSKERVLEEAGKELTVNRVTVEKGKAFDKVVSADGTEQIVNSTLNQPTSSIVVEIQPKLGMVNMLDSVAIQPYRNSTDVCEAKKDVQTVALIQEQYRNHLGNLSENENMTLVDLVDLTQKLLSNATLQPIEQKPDD